MLQVLASSYLPWEIFNFPSNLLTRFNTTEPKNALQFPNPTNTHKIANKFMTLASGELNYFVNQAISFVT